MRRIAHSTSVDADSTEPRAGWEILLDAVAAVAVVVEAWRQITQGSASGETAVLAAAVAAVVLRRWLPAVAACAGVVIAGIGLAMPPASMALWVMAEVTLMEVAMRRPRWAAVSLAVVLGAVLYLGSVLVLGRAPLDPGALILPTWTAAVVGAGLTIRAHRDRMTAVAQTAVAVLAARDSDIERHVADERIRIARDLHDSVAHSLAVMSIHAGAAAQALPTRPEDAMASVSQVQTASRTVLAEMQQIVHLLRSADGSEDTALVVHTPQGLVQVARASGTAVDADIPDDAGFGALEPVVASTVARVLQEGLTNAHRHGVGRVRVTVRILADQVTVTLENRSAGKREVAGHKPAGGFGLMGMRERVTAVGGELDTSLVDGLFTVRALIPQTMNAGVEP
jgi:signal transduction histidine kinase